MSTTTPPEAHDVTPVTIEEEMRRSYLDYAMSVIVARALPDVRDGLKPVHRRILYAMKEAGYEYNKPYKKSARIVGDVMGKYHPHGDAAIYDAMVRMAQPFSMRLTLIDGQGNFGSMDGDPPAAMRYTEARLARSAHALLEDIDKNTVDFQTNYDETTQEPVVLPAEFPNLLVNGAGGIAVGMATNIPPHNLGEVIDACCALIDNPGISIEELMEYVPGPDFPTGGLILGKTGIHAAYRTGRGSLTVRGRAEIEETARDRQAIVITEVPYLVNKARLIERIAELVRNKQIEGVGDLRDESDRRGVRVVVEIRRDAQANVVLNQLYSFTPLQTTFGVNMLALNGGRPEMMNLKEVIAAFIAFREEVITRRTIFKLGKARARAHVLAGLAVAVANLDPVIKLIRAARDPERARAELMGRDWPAKDVAPLIELIDEPGHKVRDGNYRLSETQAKAILDLRLHRLTGLEREKIAEELKGLVDEIAEYLEILRSREKLMDIMRDELTGMKEQFADARRTALEDIEFEQDIETLIQREDMVVTVSHGGYIKRVPLSTYRAQRRGGKGRAGMSMREEDVVSRVFVASTHTPVLFFSSRGIAYKLKVYKLPIGTPQARGRALVNMLPLRKDESITTVMPLPEDESRWGEMFIMFATAEGHVRRNRLSDFINVYANGKIAMKLAGGDRLVAVAPCTPQEDVLLATRKGRCIRFPVTNVRVFAGRTSMGVRGIRLAKGDEVISMSILHHVEATTEERDRYLRAANARRRLEGEAEEAESDDRMLAAQLSQPPFAEMAAKEEFILSVTEKGYGRRCSAYEFPLKGRGGQGVHNIETTARNGPVVANFAVTPGDHVVLVSDKGQIIRVPADDISLMSRRTQGVTVFRVDADEKVVSVSRLAAAGEDDARDMPGEGEGGPEAAPAPPDDGGEEAGGDDSGAGHGGAGPEDGDGADD